MSSPFSLSVNSSVYVMVIATYTNSTQYSYSYSSYYYSYSSTSYSTAYVSPSVPGTPVTSNWGTNILVNWTAPAIGAPILNYTI